MSCSNPNHHWVRDASPFRPGDTRSGLRSDPVREIEDAASVAGSAETCGDPPPSSTARRLLLRARIATLLCDGAIATCVAGQVEAQAAARARRLGPRWSSSWDGADPPFRRIEAPIPEE